MKIHVVQKGDTLWKIAKKYDVNFETLKQMNSQLADPDMIMPGMKIKIPTDSKPVKKEVMKGLPKYPAEHPYKDKSPKPIPVIKEDEKEKPIEKPIEKPLMPVTEAASQAPQPQMPMYPPMQMTMPTQMNTQTSMPMQMQQPVMEQEMQNYYTTVNIPQFPPYHEPEKKKEPVVEAAHEEMPQPKPIYQPMYQPTYQPCPPMPAYPMPYAGMYDEGVYCEESSSISSSFMPGFGGYQPMPMMQQPYMAQPMAQQPMPYANWESSTSELEMPQMPVYGPNYENCDDCDDHQAMYGSPYGYGMQPAYQGVPYGGYANPYGGVNPQLGYGAMPQTAYGLETGNPMSGYDMGAGNPMGGMGMSPGYPMGGYGMEMGAGYPMGGYGMPYSAYPMQPGYGEMMPYGAGAGYPMQMPYMEEMPAQQYGMPRWDEEEDE